MSGNDDPAAPDDSVDELDIEVLDEVSGGAWPFTGNTAIAGG